MEQVRSILGGGKWENLLEAGLGTEPPQNGKDLEVAYALPCPPSRALQSVFLKVARGCLGTPEVGHAPSLLKSPPELPPSGGGEPKSFPQGPAQPAAYPVLPALLFLLSLLLTLLQLHGTPCSFNMPGTVLTRGLCMCCDLCLDGYLLSLSPDLPGLSSNTSLSKRSSLSPLSSSSLSHSGLIHAFCFLFPSEIVSGCTCVCLSSPVEHDLLEGTGFCLDY